MAIEYCRTDDNKPPLPIAPPSLAAAYEHPDKDTIPRSVFTLQALIYKNDKKLKI